MVVLVRRDTIEVFRASGATDEHGWVLGPTERPIASYRGTLQEKPGLVGSWDAGASERGGSGPYDPRAGRRGTAYLDMTADVLPGDILRCRGRQWLATDTQFALDPRPEGWLDILEVSLVSSSA